MVVKAEQKKKIYLPHPAGQNAEHVAAAKFNRTVE